MQLAPRVRWVRPLIPLHISCARRRLARAVCLSAWCRNSEIYNHQALRDGPLAGVDLHSKSDSAVPGYLYQKYGDTNELWNSLDGIFACVIWDERSGYFCAARDPIGICSLYWGKAADGSMWFASELKAIQTACEHFDVFPPVRQGGCRGPERAGRRVAARAPGVQGSRRRCSWGREWTTRLIQVTRKHWRGGWQRSPGWLVQRKGTG